MDLKMSTRVSDQTLREAYAEHRNIAKVAEFVGLNAATVHERLNRLGVKTPPSHLRFITEADRERLRQDYRVYADMGNLDLLAEEMGRTRQLLAREARKLGLILQKNGRGRRRLDRAVWKYMDERQASMIWKRFKASPLGSTAYCKQMGWDDLGFATIMRKFFGDEWEHVIESKAPRTGLYQRGRALEYRCRDFLRSLGYFVLRSPASRSPLDLVAIRPAKVLFVQCKRHGVLNPREWNELYDLALSVGAVPLLAEQNDNQRGHRYWLLTDRKNGQRTQPRTLYEIEGALPSQEQPALFER